MEPSFPSLQTGWDKGRKLILPTYFKDISVNPTLLRVWQRARDALENATEWTVIGYSVNPADHLARMLIASALQRNENLGHVTVVDPSPAPWRELVDLHSRKLSLRLEKKKFEEWLLS